MIEMETIKNNVDDDIVILKTQDPEETTIYFFKKDCIINVISNNMNKFSDSDTPMTYTFKIVRDKDKEHVRRWFEEIPNLKLDYFASCEDILIDDDAYISLSACKYYDNLKHLIEIGIAIKRQDSKFVNDPKYNIFFCNYHFRGFESIIVVSKENQPPEVGGKDSMDNNDDEIQLEEGFKLSGFDYISSTDTKITHTVYFDLLNKAIFYTRKINDKELFTLNIDICPDNHKAFEDWVTEYMKGTVLHNEASIHDEHDNIYGIFKSVNNIPILLEGRSLCGDQYPYSTFFLHMKIGTNHCGNGFEFETFIDNSHTGSIVYKDGEETKL
jgi:hypothetical protein